MSWASAIGLGSRLETAIAEAAEELEGESGSEFDLAIAFVSAGYGAAVEQLPQSLDRTSAIACCSAATRAA